MKFSLIMGTYGRAEVIRHFLNSLNEQTYRDFELIIIDQNPDNHVAQICEPYMGELKINILRTDKRGLARARNIGLSHICGDIIAFPDDDCQYPPELLSNVHEFFLNNPNYSILTTSAFDKKKSQCYSWFCKEPGELEAKKILRMCTSFGIFIKRNTSLIRFDEQFGVGSLFGSAEEVDYVLRLLQKGNRGYYQSNFQVYHNQRDIENMSSKEVYQYSLGLGAYLKKHCCFGQKLSLVDVTINLVIVRPIGAILLAILKADFKKLKWHWARFKGRIRGFLMYNRASWHDSKKFELTA
jgi:glycosyltransferase involved in cell wall biosynthesis